MRGCAAFVGSVFSASKDVDRATVKNAIPLCRLQVTSRTRCMRASEACAHLMHARHLSPSDCASCLASRCRARMPAGGHGVRHARSSSMYAGRCSMLSPIAACSHGQFARIAEAQGSKPRRMMRSLANSLAQKNKRMVSLTLRSPHSVFSDSSLPKVSDRCLAQGEVSITLALRPSAVSDMSVNTGARCSACREEYAGRLQQRQLRTCE